MTLSDIDIAAAGFAQHIGGRAVAPVDRQTAVGYLKIQRGRQIYIVRQRQIQPCRMTAVTVLGSIDDSYIALAVFAVTR